MIYFQDSVSTKPPVTIMKFKQLTTSSDTFNVPVDELITNLTIKVQNPLGAVSSMHLYRPDGKSFCLFLVFCF